MGEQFVILGVVRVTGEYEGKPYDNYNFHCQDPAKEMTAGIGVQIVKVKTELILSSGVSINESIIGKTMSVFYDRFGRVSGITIEGAGK